MSSVRVRTRCGAAISAIAAAVALAGCSAGVQGTAVAAGSAHGAPAAAGPGSAPDTTVSSSPSGPPSPSAPGAGAHGGTGTARPVRGTVPSCKQIGSLAGSSLRGFEPAGQDIVTATRQNCRFTTGLLTAGGKNISVAVSDNPFTVELLQTMLANRSMMGDNAIDDPRVAQLGVVGQRIDSAGGTVVTLMLAGKTVTVLGVGTQSGGVDKLLDVALPVASALLK
ncbi:hypothetical protein G4X40_19440 [Rhodococcus sp. D2-41]|uniref:DUF3558 domain-containing protein n=1 Tax=Speluncibacter jeojiensis TaxID=2710754 RepID=A0A9X4LYM9_9ACTN|nr:hypothetical protein [Rhodococcus sp. D2-41]MDG3012317.1 hypothetical protein [Rhodococcus sp. D2-41]MDG3014709.1 hypothetical protein [Corynebacteriales bacterium D3-21]